MNTASGFGVLGNYFFFQKIHIKKPTNRIESKYKYNYIGPDIYMEAKKKNLSIAEEEINHRKRITGKSYFDGIITIFLNALIMIKYLFQLRNNYISKKN